MLAKLLTSYAARVLVLFMNTSPPATHPAGTSADPIGPCQDRSDRTEQHLRILAELAEIGMDLARAVRQQALGQAVPQQTEDPQAEAPQADAPEPVGGGDLALVFSHIARAVRQTAALEAKIAEGRHQISPQTSCATSTVRASFVH
jgi:hypothetical protein